MSVNTFLEPIWSELISEIDYSASAFEQKDSSFTMLSGFLVSLLQYHFSKEYYIRDVYLKDLIWDEAFENTKILIIPEYASSPDNAPNKPRITVKRNECKASTMGTLRSTVATITNGSSTNNVMGGKNCMGLIGSHSIICENVNGATVEKLAEEVYRFLLFFSPQIGQDLGLNYLNVTGIAPLTQREKIDTFIVSVNLTWTQGVSWKSKEVLKI